MIRNCCSYDIVVCWKGERFVFPVELPIHLVKHSTEIVVPGFPFRAVKAFHQDAEVLKVASSLLQIAQRGDVVLVSAVIGEALLDCVPARQQLREAGIRWLSPIVSSTGPQSITSFRYWV